MYMRVGMYAICTYFVMDVCSMYGYTYDGMYVCDVYVLRKYL